MKKFMCLMIIYLSILFIGCNAATATLDGLDKKLNFNL